MIMLKQLSLLYKIMTTEVLTMKSMLLILTVDMTLWALRTDSSEHGEHFGQSLSVTQECFVRMRSV